MYTEIKHSYRAVLLTVSQYKSPLVADESRDVTVSVL